MMRRLVPCKETRHYYSSLPWLRPKAGQPYHFGLMRVVTLIGLLSSFAGCAKDDSYDLSGLSRSLKDPDPDTRYAATKQLRKYGPKAKEAVPALVEAMSDENKDVRIGAIYALTEIGPEARAAIPALKASLKDQSRGIRYGAAVALARIDPTGTDAIPVLKSALKDKDKELRDEAAGALKRLRLKP